MGSARVAEGTLLCTPVALAAAEGQRQQVTTAINAFNMGPVSAHFLCGVAGSTAGTQAPVLHPPEQSNPKTGQNFRVCLPAPGYS